MSPILRSTHFDSSQVVAITRRCDVIDAYRSTTQRRSRILHLNPVRVTRWSQELMHDRLACAGAACNRVVIIVTYTKYPGTVTCSHQSSGRSSCPGICGSGSSNCIRKSRADGGIHTGKAHESNGTDHLLRDSGSYRDVCQQ